MTTIRKYRTDIWKMAGTGWDKTWHGQNAGGSIFPRLVKVSLMNLLDDKGYNEIWRVAVWGEIPNMYNSDHGFEKDFLTGKSGALYDFSWLIDQSQINVIDLRIYGFINVGEELQRAKLAHKSERVIE